MPDDRKSGICQTGTRPGLLFSSVQNGGETGFLAARFVLVDGADLDSLVKGTALFLEQFLGCSFVFRCSSGAELLFTGSKGVTAGFVLHTGFFSLAVGIIINTTNLCVFISDLRLATIGMLT